MTKGMAKEYTIGKMDPVMKGTGTMMI